MKTLRKKFLRDIRKNISSFITIFIMTFLGMFVFAGIHGYMDGMVEGGKKYYKNYNLQDLWAVSNGFTDEDFENLKKIDGVKDAERATVIKTDLNDHKDVVVEANFIESNNISKMYVVDGEKFDYDKEGIWLDSYLGDALKIKVGDEITLTYSDLTITGKVLGLVNTPDHVYSIKDESAIVPKHDSYGYAYVSAKYLPEEYQQFTNIYVDAEEDADLDSLKATIQAEIKDATAVTGRDTNTSYESYQGECEEGQSYSVVFTLLFLIIAILAVVSTMHRFVKKQRTQIGTLKALGVSNRKIQYHYISFGFYISLVASLLGLFIGKYVIGNFFLNMEQQYYEVPDMHVVSIPIVYVVAVLIVVFITLVTYLTCRSVLKESASEALRTERPKVKNGEVKVSKFGKKLSVGTRWNIRDIKRNKGRTLTAIVGIIGCTMLVVCALGMKDTMNNFINWQFDKLYNFEYKLEISKGVSQDEIDELTDKYGNETTMAVVAEVKDSDGKNTTQEIDINDAEKSIRYTNHNLKVVKISDKGIYLSEKLLDELGYEVGDEVEWSIYGQDTVYKTKIAGTVRMPQGQNLYMTRAYAEKIGITYVPDSIYTDEDLSDVKSIDNISLINGVKNLKKSMNTMLSMMNSIIALLIVVSVILAFVIIYNLGVLSFAEKQYQFATMKVLGFRSKAIKGIYLKQNVWISIVAIILGLPLGYLMTSVVFRYSMADSYDMAIRIKLLTYVLAAVSMFVVSYILNFFLSSMIKKIDMVSSLKANE